MDMDSQRAYVIIEEHVGEEIKYTFSYNLKECDSHYRLFKYRKTDIRNWYMKIPDIVKRELNASVYTIVFYGTFEQYQFLKSIHEPNKFHVLFGNDFNRLDMLNGLAAIGNKRAIAELDEEPRINNSNQQKNLEEENCEDLDPRTKLDTLIFEQLLQMEVDRPEQKMSCATRETLINLILDCRIKNDLQKADGVSIYMRKIPKPDSAYKYIGCLLFSYMGEPLMPDMSEELAGYGFVCLCVSSEIESEIEQDDEERILIEFSL